MTEVFCTDCDDTKPPVVCTDMDLNGRCGACGSGRTIPMVRNDYLEAAIKERDKLRGALISLQQPLSELPPGEWETRTSCSFRRISRKGGHDGDVLHGQIQRSDNHPDLSWNEKECDAICSVVNGLRAALKQEEQE